MWWVVGCGVVGSGWWWWGVRVGGGVRCRGDKCGGPGVGVGGMGVGGVWGANTCMTTRIYKLWDYLDTLELWEDSIEIFTIVVSNPLCHPILFYDLCVI
jgi:hypothetical protein